MWLACQKKSYLICGEITNFWNIMQYLSFSSSCLCPVWQSQFCTSKKKFRNRLHEYSNIRKFIISSHIKYVFFWHANHIKYEQKTKQGVKTGSLLFKRRRGQATSSLFDNNDHVFATCFFQVHILDLIFFRASNQPMFLKQE